MSRRVALALSAVFAATLTVSSQTQTPPKAPPDPQRPTFRTEANFIRVDVYPTRNGAPVTDLTAADFQVLEDGVPQKIDTFEYVQVRSGLSQDERVEPNTIQQSRDAMRDPRARVFVLFLDVPHVTIHGSWSIREPIIRLIDRVLGPDDLVGIMTPMMAATDVVFARKTQVIEGGLRDRWPWGERFTVAEDPQELMWQACYPWQATQDVIREMKARRRERTTLSALQELVNWLRDEREERKAVLAISEGWLLYRPNADLTRLRIIDTYTGALEPIPGPEPVGVGPEGRLRLGSTRSSEPHSKSDCDRDRLALSMIDNDQLLRDIMDDANRANASFYTVDPRGLPVWDSPLGPEPPPPIEVDQRNLRNRREALQVLASNTDGLAVLHSNNLDAGLRRISDDLSSYYLLGYYTSNAKLDGRFRRITVKVQRPGVDVRARRGYKAATREEVTMARTAAAAPVPESVRVASDALESLARLRGTAPLRTRAVAPKGAQAVWVAGDLAKAAASAMRADITVLTGGRTASATASIAAGQRGFTIKVSLEGDVGESASVRVRIAGEGTEPALSDGVSIEPHDGLPHPLFFRRGPSTGNRYEPAAEPQFSRTERLRLDLFASGDTTLVSGRVLDRNGTPIDLPVVIAEREDGGVRWLTGELTLAPLGPGDYVVELSGRSGGVAQQVLTAIRVTR